MYQLVFLILFSSCVSLFAEETTCQTHRRNSQAQNAPVQWDIRCNFVTGLYEPLQCIFQTPKWCVCYDEEGPFTRPSRKVKHCDCPLARHRAEERNASTCEKPECERNGLYKKKQCCAARSECHCVDEHTGQSKSEPSSDPNLRCN